MEKKKVCVSFWSSSFSHSDISVSVWSLVIPIQGLSLRVDLGCLINSPSLRNDLFHIHEFSKWWKSFLEVVRGPWPPTFLDRKVYQVDSSLSCRKLTHSWGFGFVAASVVVLPLHCCRSCCLVFLVPSLMWGQQSSLLSCQSCLSTILSVHTCLVCWSRLV